MALTKTKPDTENAAANIPAGTFEAPDDETPAAAPAAAPAPAPSASREVAQRASTAVQTNVIGKSPLIALRDLIGPAERETMGFGTFPRITVGTDGYALDKSKPLGPRIQFQLLSWNHLYMVATGENNNAEANKLIKTSHDGVTLMGGEGSVEAYVAKLKAEGYDKAACKPYIELYGYLMAYMESDPKTKQLNRVNVPEDEYTLHMISLPKTSAAQFQAYQLQAGLNVARGITGDASILVMDSDVKVNGANRYGQVKFLPKWA
jgi:hypothetical protein